LSLGLEHASLAVHSARLIEDVDFELRAGSVVAVVGANGAGKSSMLRVLSGEVSPSSGKAQIDDVDLGEISKPELARRLAVLPQHSSLDFPFRAREVIAMGRIPHFTGRATNARLVDEVIVRMQLDSLSDRIYTTLSGGERQRVQIARVLCQLWDCMENGYFMFDEPTAPLDLSYQLAFLGIAREIAGRGAGVLLVMHDVSLAARFADTIAVMRNGRILANGAVADVVTKENIRAAFDVDATVMHSEDGAPLIYTRAPLH